MGLTAVKGIHGSATVGGEPDAKQSTVLRLDANLLAGVRLGDLSDTSGTHFSLLTGIGAGVQESTTSLQIPATALLSFHKNSKTTGALAATASWRIPHSSKSEPFSAIPNSAGLWYLLAVDGKITEFGNEKDGYQHRAGAGGLALGVLAWNPQADLGEAGRIWGLGVGYLGNDSL